jgi:uncharacterized delta-60 repeat protein
MKKALLLPFILLVLSFLSFSHSFCQTISADSSFGNNGISDFVKTTATNFGICAIQPDGKVLVTSSDYDPSKKSFFGSPLNNTLLIRYNIDGSPDNTFGTNGAITISGYFFFSPIAIAIQTDGKIVVAGNERFQTAYGFSDGFSFFRYNANGSFDLFRGGPLEGSPQVGGARFPVSATLSSVAVQTDGKLVAAGVVTGNSGDDGPVLVRYNSSPFGGLDPTFGDTTATFGSNGTIFKTKGTLVSIQSDGKIVLAGTSNTGNGFTITRYTSNGMPDSSFGTDGTAITTFADPVTAKSVHIQSDGKIVLAGQAGAGTIITRYNANGSLDNSFGNAGTFKNSLFFAQSLYTQNDLKILAGGYSASINNNSNLKLARYNADGSLDGSFGNGGIASTEVKIGINNICLGATKIYAVGSSNNYSQSGAIAALQLKELACTPPTFLNNGLIILDATCNNNDGNVNIIPTSGTPPFMYSITGGATYVAGPNAGYGFQNLPSGTYKLRLKDANGCESAIVEREVKLICTTPCTPPSFVNNGLIILDATCANNDGNINILPTSGTAPFMYSINGGATYVAGPNAGYGFQNLPSGTYGLRLKDARGCESAIIERQVKLVCASSCTPPTFVNNGLIVLDASCRNNDGNINIIPTSGVAPFMYSINGGATYVAGPSAGYGFQGLTSGIYKLRLKDARGCESAIVEREVRLNCAYTCTPPTFSDNITKPSCSNNDGSISMVPTNGTPPFRYSKDGGVTYIAAENTGITFQNIPAGTYKLRLLDAHNCESAVVERTVGFRDTITITNIFITNTRCCNATIIISATNLPGNLYSINNGGTYSSSYVLGTTTCGSNYAVVKNGACVSAPVQFTVYGVPVHDCPYLYVSGAATSPTKETPVLNEEWISTYPNPSKGPFKLLLTNFAPTKAEVSVYDAKGTLIQKRSLNLTQTTIADFDIKGKAAGLYLIKVVTSNGTKFSKVLIE